MRGLPIALGLCAGVLALAPGHGAAQIMMGAGHRTDGTPSDRFAQNVPEPVSREADDPRAARRLLHPRARPGAGVEVGSLRPAGAGRSARIAAEEAAAGYSADPVPRDTVVTPAPDPRSVEERSERYDFN